MKSFLPYNIPPTLGPHSPYTVQQIVKFSQHTVPVCWNYSLSEYPDAYKLNHNDSVNGDFTQEEVVGVYDSDGVPMEMESMEGVIDSYAPTQSTLVPRGHAINDAQPLSKFKTVMNCHKSQESKLKLWELLVKPEFNPKVVFIRQQLQLLGDDNEEFLSLHLPLDTAPKSIQHTYWHSRNSKKGTR